MRRFSKEMRSDARGAKEREIENNATRCFWRETGRDFSTALRSARNDNEKQRPAALATLTGSQMRSGRDDNANGESGKCEHICVGNCEERSRLETERHREKCGAVLLAENKERFLGFARDPDRVAKALRSE
jgi:hypothetical protein